MKNKTLQQWLDEMDKLDREATKGPWYTKLDYEDFIYAPDGVAIGQIFLANPAQTKDTKFVLVARTQLPRAIRVIRYLRNRLIVAESRLEYEMRVVSNIDWTETIDRRIEKILNEEVG